MANLDTVSKRVSSVGLFNSVLAPPIPDGTLSQGDRQHIAWTYSGISAGLAIVDSSRSHKEEKRKSVDWSIPFVVQKEELETLDKQIAVVKAEINASKKEIDYSASIYEINAISNRIDDLLEKLEFLLQQRAALEEIVSRKIVPQVSLETLRLRQLEIERVKAEELLKIVLMVKHEKQLAAEKKVNRILKVIDIFNESELEIEDIFDDVEYKKVSFYRLIKRRK